MKKYWKKMIAGILIMIFALSSAVAAYAATPETTEDYDEVIAIIHTNDVHGHIEVEPYVKGLADEMKASGEYSLVLTVSAGDVYSGGHAVAGYYNGELIPAIEDQVYDVIVPGNNDFPSGIPSNVLLSALYTHTKTICANVQVKEDTDMAAYAASYRPKIGNADFAGMYDGVELSNEDGSLEFSGLDLGTIAAGTSPWQETLIVETSTGTKLGLFGLTCTYIGQTQGTVNAAKECVASLKEEGADAIVGIAHTGWMGEGSTAPSQVNDTNSWVVASEVQDMDALIDSHTHSIINDGNGCYVGDNKVLINQASCFGKCIGIMYIYLKEGKVVDKKAQLLRDEEVSALTPDPAVQATVDAAFERLFAIAGEPVATTPYYLNGGTSFENEGGHVRGNETNMGDFITDILRAAASEKAGVDFAFTFIPGYCVRSSVEESADITNIEIASIFGMPFRLGPKTYTAQEIVDLVTASVSAVNPSFGAKFMQFSGISVKYTAETVDGATIGTPVEIKVGDTVIYNSLRGGLQVDDDWSVLGLRNLHPNDSVWEGSEDELIAKSIDEVKELFHDYLATHEEGEDYTIYPNTIAPAGRIVEVDKDEMIVESMDEIQQMIDELQKQLEALKEQITFKPGWNKDGDNWVFYDDSYHLVKGWLKDGGKWYFLDKETGIMATGWVKDNDTWYYMNGSGAMQTGWLKDGSTWYYLKADGAMAANEWCTGYWLNANGTWTYQPKGSWKKDSKGWWFGDTSGWYAKNTVQKIDGVDYIFDSSGYMK